VGLYSASQNHPVPPYRQRGKTMGVKLVDKDEYTHEVGDASNWNESRYIDFWDAKNRVGG